MSANCPQPICKFFFSLKLEVIFSCNESLHVSLVCLAFCAPLYLSPSAPWLGPKTLPVHCHFAAECRSESSDARRCEGQPWWRRTGSKKGHFDRKGDLKQRDRDHINVTCLNLDLHCKHLRGCWSEMSLHAWVCFILSSTRFHSLW